MVILFGVSSRGAIGARTRRLVWCGALALPLSDIRRRTMVPLDAHAGRPAHALRGGRVRVPSRPLPRSAARRHAPDSGRRVSRLRVLPVARGARLAQWKSTEPLTPVLLVQIRHRYQVGPKGHGVRLPRAKAPQMTLWTNAVSQGTTHHDHAPQPTRRDARIAKRRRGTAKAALWQDGYRRGTARRPGAARDANQLPSGRSTHRARRSALPRSLRRLKACPATDAGAARGLGLAWLALRDIVRPRISARSC